MSSFNGSNFATDPSFECLDTGTLLSAAHLLRSSVLCKHTNILTDSRTAQADLSSGEAGPVISPQDLLSYLLSVGSRATAGI